MSRLTTWASAVAASMRTEMNAAKGFMSRIVRPELRNFNAIVRSLPIGKFTGSSHFLKRDVVTSCTPPDVTGDSFPCLAPHHDAQLGSGGYCDQSVQQARDRSPTCDDGGRASVRRAPRIAAVVVRQRAHVAQRPHPAGAEHG